MIQRRQFLKLTGTALAMVPLAFPLRHALGASQQMLTRPIPSSGEPLPIVGFGQSAAFRNGDMALSTELLDVLLSRGGRFVDTGGAGQQVMGQFMRQRDALSRLFLGTNLYSDTPGELLNEIHRARQHLGKTALDLVQLRKLNDMDGNWAKLREWKEAGLTRYIGFAMSRRNYYEPVIKLMETGTVDFVQVNYSMLEPQAAERVLPAAQAYGVAVVTNRPFVNGQYFPMVSEHELPEWAQEFDCNSWAQFSLKYILSHPAINCVLTETTKPHHAIDNLSAGFGRLPDEATRQKMIGLIRSFGS
jgi:diketogulonate reductase-like aldo/keto reductase